MHPVPDRIGPDQESVWEYPRPPRVEPSDEVIEVWLGDRVLARTARSWRVLETSHPPTYYLPRAAFVGGVLRETTGESWCEFKGRATYFDVLAGDVLAERAAWTYVSPAPGYEVLAGAIALYPGRMDRCTVDGETVVPQPGGFYGGWITSRIAGPFKGVPGSTGW